MAEAFARAASRTILVIKIKLMELPCLEQLNVWSFYGIAMDRSYHTDSNTLLGLLLHHSSKSTSSSWGCMKDLFLFLSGERKLMRDSILIVAGLAAFTYVAGQGVIEVVKAVTPPEPQRMATSDALDTRLARNYTITRSVLDEQITTGSISSLNQVRLDPCKK